MLRAWRRVFEESQPLSTQADTLEAVAKRASATTTIAELDYSVEAQNVLEGMGIHNVKELLAVDRVRFRYLKGVGDRVRKEIRLKAKRLAQLRPDLARPTLHDAEAEPRGVSSIDALAAQLLPKRPAGDDRPEERALAIYLSLEEVEGDHLWPTLGDAASQCHLPRSAVSAALLKARERWLRSPPITGVRNEIEVLLGAHGGVMTVQELALALLAAHGSAEKDDALRLRIAAAVVRACLEAEADLAQWRYQQFEHDPTPLVATSGDLADYAKRLARGADEAALAEPLLAPQRAAESLESVPRPEAVAPLATQRLLRVATATSKGAALSSRLEIYPRGMAASQAVRQSLGALVGPRFLTAEQVVERVRGRYPEAEPLPPRPALDALLAAAGAPMTWSDTGDRGPAYYQAAESLGPSAGTTTHLTRKGTGGSLPGEVTADIADARQLEERLEHSAKSGGFLALTVHPRTARHAEAELLRRFDLERVSIDALLLDALREQAKALKVDWQVVLRADTSAPGSRDWTNLMRLVHKATATVRARLLASQKKLLLVHPGLLARYELMDMVTELQNAASRPNGIPALWLLIPMVANGLPAIDGVVVPVISSAQWARIPPGLARERPSRPHWGSCLRDRSKEPHSVIDSKALLKDSPPAPACPGRRPAHPHRRAGRDQRRPPGRMAGGT